MAKIKLQVKKHIRYVFIFKQTQEVKIKRSKKFSFYYIALLTDDNEVFFDQLNLKLNPPGSIKNFETYVVYRLKSVEKLFFKYKFDYNTQICFSTFNKFHPGRDFLYSLMYLFSMYTQASLSRRTYMEIFTILRKFHKFDSRCFHKINETSQEWTKFYNFTKNINICFEGVGKTRSCPWIGPEMDLYLATMSAKKSQIYKFCLLGLWYMIIRDYVRVKKKKYLSRWFLKMDIEMSDFRKFLEEVKNDVSILDETTDEKLERTD